ncbi:hypothetical protein JRO89_XS09G0200000 [Xanthoceras sorbifolium]|uniref:Malectin-like domain-containing protein n=1 Tax=Xanthoceras sorbifolium TaxID=99658 RepID=A0ABQ8HM03_9ROSI|nr:hypothetical protein JRO89_XS09G0200000 [Xanthoceras sorbifolium]
MLRHLIFAFLGGVAFTVLLVNAQSQSGFISIDCGIPENSRYTDRITGIDYVSDGSFTDTGVSNNISPEYKSDKLEEQFLNVRSFPEGRKNCYTLKLDPGNSKFLIRASFMYGNYDGQGKVPRFDLLLESDPWESVEFENASSIIYKEVIHVPQKNYIYVCLVNTGFGAPFISALELRPLQNSTYVARSGSLALSERLDIGSTTNETFRYRDDVCDRMWWPISFNNVTLLSGSYSYFGDKYKLPSTVMGTAIMASNGSDFLNINWETSDPESKFYFYFHFAEVAEKQENDTREMTIYEGGDLCYDDIEAPRIISLNLSSSGLEGKTTSYLFGLTSIQSLDLSNNSLTGSVPDFLAELPSLTLLDLTGNNLIGSVPAGLVEKQKNGLLSLSLIILSLMGSVDSSLDENPHLCGLESCKEKKKKNKFIVPAVVASVVSVSILIIAVLCIFWNIRRRKQGTTKYHYLNYLNF